MIGRVWIQEAVRPDLMMYRTELFPLETGGILLGYVTEENNLRHWVVTAATGPGEEAKHGRYRFTPDDDHHINEAKKHYLQTGGHEYYLGDWHTHPNGSCAPSILDKLTLHKNARRAGHLGFCSLMLIIGGQAETPDYGAYVREWSQNLFRIFGEVRSFNPRFFE